VESVGLDRRYRAVKLVIAIIQDYDTDAFLKAISRQGLMATRIASAGGFLRTGNTTVFLGVEDDQVPLVKRLLVDHCRVREEQAVAEALPFLDDADFEHISISRIGGGVAFVARVERFERFARATNSPSETTVT
jgi:uncharacterized protein YaaQ